MKIKYDSNQPFQLQAISAITSVFDGQPDDTDAFDAVLRSQSLYGDQIGLFNEIGAIGNNLLLDDDAILENVKSIQNDNGIAPVEKLNGMHFSVEMETGTGKTYVYLRTALEMAKLYGFSKFIIIVPSIAIKEGVKSSLDGMREHFTREMGYSPYEASVYDGKNPEVVQSYATSTMTQFMVMTIDAIRGFGRLRA